MQLHFHDCDLIRLLSDDLIFLLPESLNEESLLLQGLVALMSHGKAVRARRFRWVIIGCFRCRGFFQLFRGARCAVIQLEARFSPHLHALLGGAVILHVGPLGSSPLRPAYLCLDEVFNQSEGVEGCCRPQGVRHEAETLLVVVHILDHLNARRIDYLELAHRVFHSVTVVGGEGTHLDFVGKREVVVGQHHCQVWVRILLAFVLLLLSLLV